MQALAAVGIDVDLTIEPGLAAVASLAPDERTTGTIESSESAPANAYRMSSSDPFAPDPRSADSIVALPLTSASTPLGPRTLTLWTEPSRFAARLAAVLDGPPRTHLAFAIRSDVAVRPAEWEAVVQNLGHLARSLDGIGQFVAAGEATRRLESSGALAARPRRVEDGPRRAEHGPLEWIETAETMSIDCLVCERPTPGRRVVRTRPETGVGVDVVRCEDCKSLAPVGPHVGAECPLGESHGSADEHIEQFGAVEVITETLAMAGERPPGSRLLDVGCGYGFGLSVASALWGWDGTGVDPAGIAQRGADELGHPLHPAPYAGGLAGDRGFDVIVASEIIEHVAEPAQLLEAMCHDLADDGVLVLTTPDAAVVAEGRSPAEIAAAVGSGGHRFLVERDGLEQLLVRAGFDSDVERRGSSLLAVARKRGTRPVEPAPVDLSELARWAHDLALVAPEGSALRVGAAARAARYSLHAADLEASGRAWDLLADSVSERHGIDLRAPETSPDRVPAVVVDGHLTAGVLALHAEDPARAARHLRTAAALGGAIAPHTPDPSPRWMQARALAEAAVACARSDPPAAIAVLRELRDLRTYTDAVVDVDATVARTFTELVAAGALSEAEIVEPWLSGDVTLASSRGDHARRAALDALFMRGMLAMQQGRPLVALDRFLDCREEIDVVDAHSRRLADDVDRHVLLAEVQATQRMGDEGTSAATPTVSVVLALYNGRTHVLDAIESVASQTHRPLELLVVDDGSTDGAADLVRALDLPFRLQVLHQDNGGQSAARNLAAAAADGEVLAFIDQDDLWHRRHLEKMAHEFDDEDVGWVYSDFDEIDAHGHLVVRGFLREHEVHHPKQTLHDCLVADLMVIPSASLIRRAAFDAVGGFDPVLRGYEDDDLYVRIFRRGWRMVFVDESLTSFRIHEGSSSTDRTFQSSRVAFGAKLKDSLGVDTRLHRRWFGDVVAPRFLHSSVDDYVRAVSASEWDSAIESLEAVAFFAEGLDDPAWRWRLRLFRRPRLVARLMRMNEWIPGPLRPVRHGLYRLR